jgi:hypothetical protein
MSKRKRETNSSTNISRKKKKGGLTKNEQEDKKEEEKRLSQEITVLWKDHVDQNLSELHSEIIKAKLGRNTSLTKDYVSKVTLKLIFWI